MNEDVLMAALQKAEEANTYTTECQVCVAIAQMGSNARSAVEGAIADATIGTATLARILTESGYPTGRRAIINHKGHQS